MANTRIKINAQSSEYQREMRAAVEETKRLASEVTVAATQVKLFGENTQTLEAKQQALTAQLSGQTKVVETHAREIDRLTKQLAGLKTKQEELKGEVDDATTAYEKQVEATGKNSAEAKKLKVALDELTKQQNGNESAILRTETAITKVTTAQNKSKVATMETTAELKKNETSTSKLKDAYNAAKGSALAFADTLKGKLAPVALATAAIKLLGSAFNTLKKAISEGMEIAQKYNEQFTTLEQVMRNTMGATDKEIKSIEKLAEAQEKIGVVSKAAQVSALAELATFVERKEALEDMLPVMNDYIAYQYKAGASEEQARNVATALGKAIQGNIDGLAKQGFTLTETERKWFKTATEVERVAFVMDMVSESMDGMNEAFGKMDTGKLLHANTALAEMKQTAGELANDIKTEFMGTIAPALESLAQEIKIFYEDNKVAIQGTVEVLGELTSDTLEILSLILKFNNEINRITFNPFKAQTEALENEAEAAEKVNKVMSNTWPINGIEESTDAINEQTDAIKEQSEAEQEAKNKAEAAIKKHTDATNKKIEALQNEQKEAEAVNQKIVSDLQARQKEVEASYKVEEAAAMSRYDAEIAKLNELKKKSTGEDAYADYLKSANKLNAEWNEQFRLSKSFDKETREAAQKRLEEINRARKELNEAESKRKKEEDIDKQIADIEKKRDAEIEAAHKATEAENERIQKRINNTEKATAADKAASDAKIEALRRELEESQKVTSGVASSFEDSAQKSKTSFTQMYNEINKSGQTWAIQAIQQGESVISVYNRLAEAMRKMQNITTGNSGVSTGTTTLPRTQSLNVEWYRNGAIMTQPTIFGVNGTDVLAGGEAGAEAILPLAPFYVNLTQILDEKMRAYQQQTPQGVGRVVTTEKETSVPQQVHNNYHINVQGIAELQEFLDFQDNLRRRERAAGKRK